MEKLQKTRHGVLKGTFEEIPSQFIIHHFLRLEHPKEGGLSMQNTAAFLTTVSREKGAKT
jgi:hypothetical protein